MVAGMTSATLLKINMMILLILIVFPCHAMRDKKMSVISLMSFVQEIKTKLPEGISFLTPPFHSSFIKVGGNKSFSIYKSEDFKLGNEMGIERVEARVFKKNDLGVPFLLTFKISGECIKLNELKLHYPELTATNIPRGDSLDEETSYSTSKSESHLKLVFGFSERNPNCLRSIVFNMDEFKVT